MINFDQFFSFIESLFLTYLTMTKKIEITVSLEIFKQEEWTDEDRILIIKAQEALENAHAPYSNFLVGAALLMENGEIFTANNQENVSFPVGVCAERAVLTYAHGNHPKVKPLKIAIAAKRRLDNKMATVTPCGLCRQTINEYELKFGHPIEILMLNPEGEILKASGIEQLLPFRFNDLNS
jgi:cytidine deaminase